jgi:hypothetical protein
MERPREDIEEALERLDRMSRGAHAPAEFKLLLFRPSVVEHRERAEFAYYFFRQFPELTELLKRSIVELDLGPLEEPLWEEAPEARLAGRLLVKLWTGLELNKAELEEHRVHVRTEHYKDTFLMVFSQFRVCKQVEVSEQGWLALGRLLEEFCHCLYLDEELFVGRKLLILLFSYTRGSSKETLSGLVREVLIYQDPEFWLSSIVETILEELTKNPSSALAEEKDRLLHERNVVIPQLTAFSANLMYFLEEKAARKLLTRVSQILGLSSAEQKFLMEAPQIL